MNVFCALSLFNKGRKYTYIYVFKLYTSFEWHLIIQIIIIIFWRNSKTICIKGKRTSSVQSKLLWRGEFQRKGAEERALSPHVWCSVLGGTERRGRDLNWMHWGSRSLRRFGGGGGQGWWSPREHGWAHEQHISGWTEVYWGPWKVSPGECCRHGSGSTFHFINHDSFWF